MTVTATGDKVMLDLGGRRRDVLLTPLCAARLAGVLDEQAALAERAPPELVRGEVWEVGTDSYDGRVVLRFTPPGLGHPERVPLPASVARQLAETLRRLAVWAGYRARLMVG